MTVAQEVLSADQDVRMDASSPPCDSVDAGTPDEEGEAATSEAYKRIDVC